jgi:hypothetical protein
MRPFLIIALAVGLVGLAGTSGVQGQGPMQPDDSIPIYRLYNPGNQDHLLTYDGHEATELTFQGFNYEGIEFYAAPRPGPGLIPLHRFSNWQGTHFYQTNRNSAQRPGVQYEGVLGYIARQRIPGTQALYRWYNSQHDLYFYTTDPRGEAAGINQYRYDGIVGYVVK